MADRVLIPLPGLGTLSLSVDQYREALAASAELGDAPAPSASASDEPLLDAELAALRLGVTARWLEDSARAGIVPHHKFGRFIRFNVREIAAQFRVEGAAPPTDYQSDAQFRRLVRQ